MTNNDISKELNLIHACLLEIESPNKGIKEILIDRFENIQSEIESLMSINSLVIDKFCKDKKNE